MSIENKQEIDWAAHAEDVARALFGEPNKESLKRKDWRWGNKGSLSVNVKKGVYTDHEKGEHGGIYDLIRRELHLSGKEAVDWLRKECPGLEIAYTTRAALDERRKAQEAERRKADEWKAQKAGEIWRAAKPLSGTLAESYLKGREVSATGSKFLRFDPECQHSGLKSNHPALIGGVSVWPSETVVAVHRTYLGEEGGKLSASGHNSKMMLGPVSGGAVRLSEGMEGALVLCEGIETGLSLVAASGLPVWAALSTSGLKAVVLPPCESVSRVIIAADHDKNRAGMKAAEERAAKLHKEGYEVLIALPTKAEQDFNDLHREAGIEAVKRALDAAKPFDPEPLPKLLNGEGWPYFVNEKGVFYVSETTNREGETNEETKWLSTPVHVEAKTQDGNGKGWGRLLCVINDLGQRNRVIVSAADISEGARAGVFRTLSAYGAKIPASKGLRDKLLDYLMEAKPEKHMICAERIGWHEPSGAFVLPDQSYGGRVDAPVIYGPQNDGRDHPYRVKGTLESWRAAVAEPCRGNSRLIFSLCVACAGPFLRLVDGEGGMFHFSGTSSIGKSTTLSIAGSFWGGGGLHGFRDTWRATDNALENKALAHSDTLICLDELGQADAHAAQKATYMLAQGTGKARMSKNGESQAALEWRINGLSSGEIGMADKLAEGRGRYSLKDGQEARFVEIPADAGADLGLFETLGQFETPAALADHLKEAAIEHYGAPARALLDALADDPRRYAEQARDAVKRFKEILAQNGASAAVDRVATRFALVATAGSFAAKKGILPFEPGEIRDAVRTCYLAWITHRGGNGSRETYEGVARMGLFIGEFSKSRFQSWKREPFENIQKRAGFRRPENEDGLTNETYFFLPAVLRREVLEGLDAKNCISGLVDEGFLEAKDGDPSLVLWVPSEGRALRLYQVTPRVFEIE